MPLGSFGQAAQAVAPAIGRSLPSGRKKAWLGGARPPGLGSVQKSTQEREKCNALISRRSRQEGQNINFRLILKAWNLYR